MRLEGVPLRFQGLGLVRAVAALAAASWMIALSVGLVLLGLPTSDGSDDALTAVTWLGLAGLPLWLVTLVTLFLARTARRAPGNLEVGEHGLVLTSDEGRRVVPHEAVREGWYDRLGGEVVLTIGRGDVLRVGALAGRAQAEALLDAVAAGATERALELGLRREITITRWFAGALLVALLFPLLAVVSRLESLAALVATAAAYAALWVVIVTRYGTPERLVVGYDGLALEGPWGVRFIPYARITDVAPSVDGVVLELEDLSRLPIRLVRPRAGRALDLSLRRRDHVLARVRAELAAWRAAQGEPLGAALLDRKGRSLPAWRDALRELGARATASYRAASVDPEHLAHVLEARDAAPERRVGAAMVLAASEDPALRRRLRIFIDRCADDALRRALEEAASEELDEDALAGAMDRLGKT